MCIAVSGRCFTSVLRHGRSANRGDCLQPCRRTYRIYDEDDGGEMILDGHTVMNAKDLCTIDILDRITVLRREFATEIGLVVLVDGKPEIGPDGKPVRAGGRLRKILQERQKNRENLMGASRAIAAENIRAAEQYSKVEITKAQKMVAVAEINLEAAEDLAEALRQKGFAEADVILMNNNAQAEGVRAKVEAFGSGEKYAEYLLSIKLSPAVKRILSNTKGTFADLFNRFTGETPKGAK